MHHLPGTHRDQTKTWFPLWNVGLCYYWLKSVLLFFLNLCWLCSFLLDFFSRFWIEFICLFVSFFKVIYHYNWKVFEIFIEHITYFNIFESSWEFMSFRIISLLWFHMCFVFLIEHLLVSHLLWIWGIEGLLTKLIIFLYKSVDVRSVCEVYVSITLDVF